MTVFLCILALIALLTAPGKSQKLLKMTDAVEAHLSLWCVEPTVSEFVQVKP